MTRQSSTKQVTNQNEITLAGLDECGRGALAGPLVAAAVILNCTKKELIDNSPAPIKDSKQLSKPQRQKLTNYLELKTPRGWDTLKNSNVNPSPEVNGIITYALSIITVEKINQKGIAWANQKAFISLLAITKADRYIIDGNLRFPPLTKGRLGGVTLKNTNNVQPPYEITSSASLVETKIKADQTILEVTLASIIAKVYRDQLMQKLHHQLPNYHWHTNAGYGTQKHIQALSKHGPTAHHRTQFINTALRNYNSKI